MIFFRISSSTSKWRQTRAENVWPTTTMVMYVTHIVTLYLYFKVGNYYYGAGHCMKPHRIRMAHHLIVNYALYRQMEVYVSLGYCKSTVYLSYASNFCNFQRPHPAQSEDISKFHTDDYVSFLKTITPESMKEHKQHAAQCTVVGLLYYCTCNGYSILINFV